MPSQRCVILSGGLSGRGVIRRSRHLCRRRRVRDSSRHRPLTPTSLRPPSAARGRSPRTRPSTLAPITRSSMPRRRAEAGRASWPPRHSSHLPHHRSMALRPAASSRVPCRSRTCRAMSSRAASRVRPTWASRLLHASPRTSPSPCRRQRQPRAQPPPSPHLLVEPRAESPPPKSSRCLPMPRPHRLDRPRTSLRRPRWPYRSVCPMASRRPRSRPRAFAAHYSRATRATAAGHSSQPPQSVHHEEEPRLSPRSPHRAPAARGSKATRALASAGRCPRAVMPWRPQMPQRRRRPQSRCRRRRVSLRVVFSPPVSPSCVPRVLKCRPSEAGPPLSAPTGGTRVRPMSPPARLHTRPRTPSLEP